MSEKHLVGSFLFQRILKTNGDSRFEKIKIDVSTLYIPRYYWGFTLGYFVGVGSRFSTVRRVEEKMKKLKAERALELSQDPTTAFTFKY